ncbi:hypothetical protein HRJ34_17870 [Rhizorhabdus wittichii]|uniref:Uncharacterized protein n=1 Tax=Rhizorhabdus wittichii TaxID=160791 RepID=A0A975CZR5_9SPHN|nr:hypothetical protein [Rhizorhabdus wittichii]QTH20211.1 hypothetical protein HRJ34_17870 [Rhizorhabdus wittichii]
MRALEDIETLTPVTTAQIKEWVECAWSKRSVFPSAAQYQALAAHLNIIVAHHNVRKQRRASQDDLKRRIAIYRTAANRAKLLKADLEAIKRDLQLQHELLTDGEIGFPFHPALTERMSSLKAIERAIDDYELLFPSPSKKDHMDPVGWIADGVEVAWKEILDLEQGRWGKTKGFGHQPDSPLTYFVQLALEGMGMPHSDNLDTISDHLRRRHNRKRVRLIPKGMGAKTSLLPPAE